MALRLNGSSSGYVELDVPAAAGSHTLTLPNSGGSSGQYLQTNGSGGLSWQTVASLSNAEDGAGTDFEFNSGYGSNATAYGVRAWVNFDGTQVTNPGSTTGIRASGNVSSVTDNATGDYTVNFTTAMPDTNYAVVATGMRNAAYVANTNPLVVALKSDTTYTNNVSTSSFSVTAQIASISNLDPRAVNVAVFR